MIRTAVRLAAAALVATAATAQAQDIKPFEFGVAGGIALPTGDLGDIAKSGYQLRGLVNVNTLGLPVGVRAELGYNSFGIDGADGDVSVLGLDVNAVYKMAGVGVRPYFIGGLGMYRSKIEVELNGQSASESSTDVGINVGGGLSFALGGLSTFVEARYYNIFADESATMIPVTFGIVF